MMRLFPSSLKMFRSKISRRAVLALAPGMSPENRLPRTATLSRARREASAKKPRKDREKSSLVSNYNCNINILLQQKIYSRNFRHELGNHRDKSGKSPGYFALENVKVNYIKGLCRAKKCARRFCGNPT
jgi:hypothetical protein